MVAACTRRWAHAESTATEATDEVNMDANELLNRLRAERDAAEQHYKTITASVTFADVVNQQHPMHKAQHRHQDICTAVIEVARILGVTP